MAPIPFPMTSSPGKPVQAGAGRLINCRYALLPTGARAPGKWQRAPGLRSFGASPQAGHRGQIVVGSALYAAFANNVTRFDSAGTAVSVGTLNGTAKVFWARNNRLPTPDLVVVDPDNGASVVTVSSVASYPDADVGAPNSVCFLDGYFFFSYGDGSCIASDLNSTAINPLTSIKCEGNPDGLLRAIPFRDLYLAGTASIEVWRNTAETAPAFPFSRVTVIPRGLIGRHAITGFEDGIGKALVFVGNDRRVHLLDGYTPTPVSTLDVDYAIASFIEAGGDPGAIEMFPYALGGHSAVVLRCPAWCWVFDLDALSWHERASYLSPTWRATGAINAFGKWIAGDASSGNLLEISEFACDEAGTPLIFQLESGPVTAFPNRVAVAQASFDVAQGVGIATGSDPAQTEPTLFISYSDDAGDTWSTPRARKLGRQGERPQPIKLTRCGAAGVGGRRWRLIVSDAVDVNVFGGDQLAEVRMA
jgi:hypothetical protein